MNISVPLRAESRIITADQWLIYRPGCTKIVPMVAATENEAHHEYRSLFSFDAKDWHLRLKSGIRVCRFNAHDDTCRDVTFDFADFGDE